MISEGNILGMLITRPIAIVIFLFAILQILDQIPSFRKWRRSITEKVKKCVRPGKHADNA